MTGRPTGAKQINKHTWATKCLKCGCTLINVGSGRPRNNCGNHKKIRVLIGKAEQEQRKVAHVKEKHLRQHALVNAIKMSVGECYYHEQYFGHELLITEQTLRAFCWDHVDRADKLATIAHLIGRHTDHEIIAEINKCVLSCTNCHQIKTYEQNDYQSLKQAKIIIKSEDMQLNLFAV